MFPSITASVGVRARHAISLHEGGTWDDVELPTNEVLSGQGELVFQNIQALSILVWTCTYRRTYLAIRLAASCFSGSIMYTFLAKAAARSVCPSIARS